MPSRIWQFSLGAIALYVTQSSIILKLSGNKILRKITPFIILIAGLLLILASAVMLKPDTPYPGLWATIPSIGTFLCIIAGAHIPKHLNPLSHPTMVWVGDRSYSLYLWHWPIFIIASSLGYAYQPSSISILILLTTLISIFSYRLIELPFWKGSWSQIKPTTTILISMIAILILFTLNHVFDEKNTASKTLRIKDGWSNNMPIIYKHNCDSWYKSSKVEPCIYGSDSAKKTIVLIGDSIAAQWFSMIPEIFPEPIWRTIVITKASCPMVDVDFYYAAIRKKYGTCTTWRNKALDLIGTVKPDVVIMGSASTYNFSPIEWQEGSSRVFERISHTAPLILVIAGTPTLGFNGPGCLLKNRNKDGEVNPDKCESKGRIKIIKPITLLIQKAADKFPNTYVLNFNELVCPGGNCYAIDSKGMLIFRDSQHLTDHFVRSITPQIRERIMKILTE